MTENSLRALSYQDIPVGKIEISHGLSSERAPEKRRFNQEDLKGLKAWQLAGVLRIAEKKDLSKEFTGWNDFAKLTQDGVGKEVEVFLTQRGKVLNRSEDAAVARISAGTFAITQITSNEIKELEFDTYCLISGLYDAEWSPEFEQVIRVLTNTALTNHRKFQALFKHDKIDGLWKFVVMDVADKNQDFFTSNVRDALMSRR